MSGETSPYSRDPASHPRRFRRCASTVHGCSGCPTRCAGPESSDLARNVSTSFHSRRRLAPTAKHLAVRGSGPPSTEFPWPRSSSRRPSHVPRRAATQRTPPVAPRSRRRVVREWKAADPLPSRRRRRPGVGRHVRGGRCRNRARWRPQGRPWPVDSSPASRRFRHGTRDRRTSAGRSCAAGDRRIRGEPRPVRTAR